MKVPTLFLLAGLVQFSYSVTRGDRLAEIEAAIASLQDERELLVKTSPILPDFNACEGAEILSWHIHVSFHASDPVNSSFALGLRDTFISEFGLSSDECPMGHLEPASQFTEICAFPLEYPAEGPYAGTGPFDLPNFSFFVPASGEFFLEALRWWTQNRGPLSIISHPNSGCQDYDHGTWPVFGGPMTTLNVPQGLACCHTGPPGCGCYVNVYYFLNGDDSDDAFCLSSDGDTGAVTLEECDPYNSGSSALVTSTNYTDDFHQIEAFTTYPRADRCIGPLTGSCEVGSQIGLVSCTDGSDEALNTTRLTYDVGQSTISLDGCSGVCIASTSMESGSGLELAACGESGTLMQRLCAMAPHNTPIPCPDVQY